jgi:hypothetical protein
MQSHCHASRCYCLFFNLFIILFIAPHTVVSQSYTTHVSQEYVISGNDVLFKCGVPSHVADFVTVVSWIDSEGAQIVPGSSLTNGTLNDTVSRLCVDAGLRMANRLRMQSHCRTLRRHHLFSNCL